MHFTTVTLLSLVAVTSVATPTSRNEVHEKRTAHPLWTKRYSLDGHRVLPMRIALKQQNLDNADQYIMDVSHPGSQNFGKHWTPEEVMNTFRPSEKTTTTVRGWLHEAGVQAGRIKFHPGDTWINFNATVHEAESLFKTKYHMFEHEASGTVHVACDEYSLPSHVKHHVDFVLPSVHFDSKLRKRDVEAGKSADIEKRQIKGHRPTAGTGRNIGKVHSGSGGVVAPKRGRILDRFNQIIGQLQHCDQFIVPNCLRALYAFPPGVTKNPRNSYGIVEYTPQAYVPGDLDLFFTNFSSRQVGNRPIFNSVQGGVNQQQEMSFGLNGESDLDLEYAMALVYPQSVTLYQVGDLVEGASFNNFLDGLDASYCTSGGGDDPLQDATYPDPLDGGYKGKDCGKYAPAKVISTSYGYNEADLSPAYEQRQCNEYMKLGLMGTSVLYSSGDFGVAGNGGECIDPVTGNYVDGDTNPNSIFNPSFPSTCPYVSAIGATQVKPGNNIINDLATGVQPEEACETVIFSGGGFSNNFALPAYQSAAVTSFFTDHPPPYTAALYNNSRTTRGYPDISANGANYVVAVDGQFSLVYGTSASSPTVGAIVTLINEARFAIGKGSVGFLNPTLYANPGVLNDITQGGNQGCSTPGFTATTGWDPVTGLGTPDFPKLVRLYLGLP